MKYEFVKKYIDKFAQNKLSEQDYKKLSDNVKIGDPVIVWGLNDYDVYKTIGTIKVISKQFIVINSLILEMPIICPIEQITVIRNISNLTRIALDFGEITSINKIPEIDMIERVMEYKFYFDENGDKLDNFIKNISFKSTQPSHTIDDILNKYVSKKLTEEELKQLPEYKQQDYENQQEFEKAFRFFGFKPEEDIKEYEQAEQEGRRVYTNSKYQLVKKSIDKFSGKVEET